MKKKLIKFIKVWLAIAKNAALIQLATHVGGYIFLIGKAVRFIFTFVFLFSIMAGVKNLAGYSQNQVIVFFLVFNLIDILSQLLFRGVYMFRNRVVSGDFDLDLLKPMPSFFRPIFGWTDVFDLLTLPPFFIYFYWFLSSNQIVKSPYDYLLFFVLIINGLLVSFAFHLFICGVCVLTTEIDHLVWLYRDLSSMGRFPTDIYPIFVQIFLTVVVPIIIMITIPAKSLLGIVNIYLIIGSLFLGIVFFFFSFWFWRYSLKKYSSASS